MSDATQPMPDGTVMLSERPASLPRALLDIWWRPAAVMRALAPAPHWSWIIPMALAVILVYMRLGVMALLQAPLSLPGLLGGLGTIVLGWPLRASILSLASGWGGARQRFAPLFELSAWAALPLVLRDAVQVGYMLLTGDQLASPGLSGLLLSAEQVADPVVNRLGAHLLGRIDLFSLWFLLLLVIAVRVGGRLSAGRALLAVILYSVLSLGAGLLVALV